ncbi:DUF2863 family protein [Undibacterium sp. SXout7W]|uniref:DUF2863 family protein n=1 Tax=Undibacterium sp. SXout7W TaxID=3413049 RepID=UPI003BF310B6
MRRPIKRNRIKLAAESQRIANLAIAVTQSASRLEDLSWQARLDATVTKNFKLHHQDTLDAACEFLFQSQPDAYEVMIETLETVSTSATLTVEGKQYSTLLIAAPVLAWTRFEIASAPIPAETATTLAEFLHSYILADDTQLNILPNLYSIDQLPKSHCDVYATMEKYSLAQLKNSHRLQEQATAQTVPFLADIRYVLATLTVPVGTAMFRWQNIDAPYDCAAAKNDALSQWQLFAEPVIQRMLPGCSIELLMPEAYYTACREADIRIRPASIRSAVFYLTQSLGKEANQFSAVIASFGEQEMPGQIDEYRVSFCLKDSPEVIYGVVWPLYQADDQNSAVSMDESGQLTGEIAALLKESGIDDILPLEDIFSMEFCDDCGTPLFADRDADLVHTEMPDDLPTPGTAHFH